MINKKEALNTRGDIFVVGTKYIRCWYCQLHGDAILDKWGCCKRCGTNLKKWSKRGKLIYPILDSSILSKEVLGIRKKCDVPSDDEAEMPQDVLTKDREKNSGKVNHCQICWQKTLLFIWSTSRVIDKEKLGQIGQFKNVVNLERLGYPICWTCIGKYNLIVGTKEGEDESRNI